MLTASAASGCAPQAGTAPSSVALPEAAVHASAAPLAPTVRLPKGFSTAPPEALPLGSYYFNPVSGRREVVLGDLAGTAVLIGDSQAEPADSWLRRGLERAGYRVYFAGRGGTGFTVGIEGVHDYVDALRLGDWYLPYGKPSLVVVQGGGNDATRHSADAAIVSGAKDLIGELHRTYPGARVVMVGTLAKSAADGGGRRTEVDALLGRTSAQLGVPFIPCGDWISRYNLGAHLADAVHLKPEGHALLAPVFGDALSAKGLALG
ncbi:MAG: SGNH/GDSL hydrolase family protein [Sinomonas sp.]|nr:SGNH/GDSL hydrolase family protein [Sinomonas sp.]